MANIFHVERTDNKITLGTTDTTILIDSHTASKTLALNADKELESIQSLIATATPTFAGLTLSSIAAEGADVDKFLVDSTGVIKYRTGAQVLSDIGAQTQGTLLDSLNTLGPGGAVATEILVCLNDGSYAWQTGATARSSLGIGTGNSPQFTGIELGHATDTTITRVSAGVIAVEGTTVMMVGAAPTAHSIASHNDTSGTGAELNTLTDGSDAGALHSHAAAYQPLDTGLTNLAALGYVSDSMIKITAEDTYEIRTMAQVLSDIGAAASGHNHSGVYEPVDAELTSLAALTYSEASFIKMTGAGTFVLRTIANVRTDLSITNVEDTAISGWAGSGNITTVGALASGSIAAGFTSIGVAYTDAKCTDAAADETAANETSHALVLVDGDFGSAGLMNTDGAGAYSIKAIGTDVQAFHANLAAIAGGTWTGANSITTLGTIATGTWQSTDVGIAYGGTGASTAQLAINALSAVGAATNEHVLTKDTGTGNAIWKVAAGSCEGDAPGLNDSESNAMLVSTGPAPHAYLAQTSGYVNAYHDSSQDLFGWVGATDDPIGAGLQIAQTSGSGASGALRATIMLFVPNGMYFEITRSGADGVQIIWTPLVSGGAAPIDQD